MRLVLATLMSLFVSTAFAATDTFTPTVTQTSTKTSTRTASPTRTATATISPSPTPGAILAYYAGDSGCQLCNYIGSSSLALTVTGSSITNPSSPTPAQGDRSLGTGFASSISYFKAPTSVMVQNGTLAFFYYAYPQISQPSTEMVIEIRGTSPAKHFLVTYNYSQQNFRIYYNGAPGSGAVFVESPALSVNTNAWNKVLINHNQDGVAIKLNSGAFTTNATVWNSGTVSQVGIGGSNFYFPMTSTNLIDAVLFSSQINEGFPPTLPTATATATGTNSPTRTVTRTFTFSPTFSHSPTESPTFSVSPTPTHTRTVSPTFTFTPTASPTRTVTGTATPTATRTVTPSPTFTSVVPSGLVRSVTERIAFTGVAAPNTYTFTLGRTPVAGIPFTGGYIDFNGGSTFFWNGNSITFALETDAAAMAPAISFPVLSYVSNKTIRLRDPGNLGAGGAYVLTVNYLSAE